MIILITIIIILIILIIIIVVEAETIIHDIFIQIIYHLIQFIYMI
jgi:hypothetical protein